jgi:hypothetical protein
MAPESPVVVIARGSTGRRVRVLREGTRARAASVQAGVADVARTGTNAMATRGVQRTFGTPPRDARVAGEEVRSVPEIFRRLGAGPGFGGRE